jgi:hypothetical protein
MRIFQTLGVSLCLFAGASTAFADQPPLDCSKKSLAAAVSSAGSGDSIRFTGICTGQVVVRTDNLTLTGVGTAIIDGGGKDAVTVAGAHGVVMSSFEVHNGTNGILGVNGAHIAITSVSVHDNFVFGISLQTASSAVLTNVTISHNFVHGLDLETGSAATITGSFSSSANKVFGVNVNGSSLTFAKAMATISGNAVGMQVATSGNAFLNDANTVLNVTGSLADGLTVVSGAHMVSFGGTINSSGNALNGVALNSKAGLDLDAGSQLNTFNNGTVNTGDGLLLQEGSVMTVFNIPQFSGAPGYSTVNSHNNRGNGVRVLGASTFTLSNQAKVVSMQNGASGFVADNGIALTLVNSTLSGNTAKDLTLTFGTRADISSTTLGTYSCDATVLTRGPVVLSCPH